MELYFVRRVALELCVSTDTRDPVSIDPIRSRHLSCDVNPKRNEKEETIAC